MPMYRKKPVEIEARELTEDTADRIARWCSGQTMNEAIGQCPDIDIPTLEGTMRARPGDFVIRGVSGEFYPCKSDIFAATYERVADDGSTVPVSEMRGDEAP